MPDRETLPTPRYWLIAIIALLLVLEGWIYHSHRVLYGQAREMAEQQLQSVATLKSREVEHWLADRLLRLSQSPNGMMVQHFGQLSSGRDVASSRSELQAHVRQLQVADPEISAIWLYDLAGHGLLASDGAHSPKETLYREAARKAGETHRPVLVDFHRSEGSAGNAVLDIVVPLLGGTPGKAALIGYGVFEIDPRVALYPMVQRWPVSSDSAETFLVRQEGEGVLALSPLRHQVGLPLDPNSPLTASGFLTSQALSGEGQVLAGVDYRGKPALGFALKVSGTEWTLVAKLDEEEVYQGVQRHFLWGSAASLVLLLIILALARAFFLATQARAREERYRMLAESGSDVVWLFQLATQRLTYVSPSIERVRGYTVAETLQQGLRDLVTPESYSAIDAELPAWLARFAAGDETARIRHFEFDQPCKNGSVIQVEAAMTLITDARGQVTHIQGISRDISQRKKVEDELRKFMLSAEQSPVSIVITDLDAKIEYVNQAFVSATGYSREEARGQNPRILQSGTTPKAVYAAMWANLSQGLAWHGELHNRRKDGSEYLEVASISPIRQADGKITHYLAVKEDVTERRQIEAALAESEEKFRTIFNTINDAIFVHDAASGRVLDVNFGACQMYGYSREQLLDLDVAAITAGNDVFTPEAALDRIKLAKEQEAQAFEWMARDSAGRQFWITVNLQSMRVGSGQRVLAVVRDIDARKRAEEQLRAALRVVEASPAVGFRWRAEAGWPVEYVSANVSRWGYRADDLLSGKVRFTEMLHPDDLDRVATEVATYVAEKRDEFAQEYRLRGADGDYFWAEDHTHVVRDASGQPVVYEGVVTDVDARKRAEVHLMEVLEAKHALNLKLEAVNNQLLQSEKMAAIGQLAAGVAHELNNPIGFVSSNLGTLERYLQDIFAVTSAYEAAEAALGDNAHLLDTVHTVKRDKDFDYLKTDIGQLMAESRDGLARVAKIVRDLKDFSHAGVSTFNWANLHQGLDSTLNIVWNELKYKCTVKKDYGELPLVWCVISQLNQVFMNLLVNAAHAIPVKGEITLQTGRRDEEVFVSVADTGTGIAPENLGRIFEPFFTTKPVGKGTGLGLSLAYSIVQKHRGRIEVQSEVGKGSTFTVWLPIRAKDVEEALDTDNAGPAA